MTEESAKVILQDAHKIISEAHEAKRLFTKLAIACIVSFFSAVTVVSVSLYKQKQQDKKIDTLWRESMPIWLNQGLTKLYTINTEKIVERLTNDPTMLQDIRKYNDEMNQNVEMLMNALISSRGGTGTVTRGIKSGGSGSSSAN